MISIIIPEGIRFVPPPPGCSGGLKEANEKKSMLRVLQLETKSYGVYYGAFAFSRIRFHQSKSPSVLYTTVNTRITVPGRIILEQQVRGTRSRASIAIQSALTS